MSALEQVAKAEQKKPPLQRSRLPRPRRKPEH
jgi:hypothetical protein